MSEPGHTRVGRWWAEPHLWAALALMALAVFPRLDALPLRGEEHRRAQVLVEMRAFDDWVVPRDQGHVFRSRPPFQQWLIAAAEWVFGDYNRWVIRLPSAIATMLMTVVLYGYTRRFVGPTGALVAALAYGTGGQVVGEAQQAETEAMYAFFIGSSLLLWHWGYTQKWPPFLTWSVAYLFAAAAGLCKGGLQPPVYLVGPAGLYLLWKRDLRFFFSGSHLIGAAVGLAAVAAWAIPCAERVGWGETRTVWMSDTSGRLVNWKLGEFLTHLVVFPAELFPCLLPWGLLIPAAIVPAVRRSMAGNDAVAFCLLGLFVAVPSCWLPPPGQPRYLAPIYPCFGVLVGVLADRASSVAIVGTMWTRYLIASAGLFVGCAVVGIVGVWVFPGTSFQLLALPLGSAVGYAIVLVALACVVVRARNSLTPTGIAYGAFVVAIGSAVVNTGAVTDGRAGGLNDPAVTVAPIRQKIPAGATVVTVGEVNAAVRYHLREIAPRTDEVPPGAYFCVQVWLPQRPEFPFAWQEIGIVSVERFKHREVRQAVLIGHRLPDPGP